MDTTTTNPIKRANRRYKIEFGLAISAYVIVFSVRTWLFFGPLHLAGKPWISIAVALMPVIPIAFVGVAVLRWFRAVDELMRRILTESLAIAGAVTAFSAATYGFLENPPWFPYLSAWW